MAVRLFLDFLKKTLPLREMIGYSKGAGRGRHRAKHGETK